MRRMKTLIGIGIALVVVAAGVRFIAAPAFIRFPLGIDRHSTYTGRLTTTVNPVTLAPLASPRAVPLTIDRQIKVLRGTYSTAIVRETIVMHFAGQTSTETYQYALDRRSMQLKGGKDTYALGNPANTMAVKSSYRVNLPLSTRSTRNYAGFVPQSDSIVTMRPVGAVHHDPLSNSDVVTFAFSADHAVAPYYLAHLRAAGFPGSLSTGAFEAQLSARGVNLNAVMGAVRSHLSPAQFAALTAVLAKPVPLSYTYFEQGTVGVDPTTGAVITTAFSREGVAVAPDLSGFSALSPMLSRLMAIPAVQSLAQALATAKPQPVLTFGYTETAASARSAASNAGSQATLIDLLDWWLPIGLAALGVLTVLAGLLVRPRHQPPAAPQGSAPAPQPEKPRLPV